MPKATPIPGKRVSQGSYSAFVPAPLPPKLDWTLRLNSAHPTPIRNKVMRRRPTWMESRNSYIAPIKTLRSQVFSSRRRHYLATDASRFGNLLSVLLKSIP